MMRRRQPQRNRCLLATAVLYAVKPATVSAQEGDLKYFDADSFFTREDMEAISAQCENLDYVTKPLFVSDADGNGLLSQNEFAVFTDLVSGGWLSEMGMAGSFQKMPLVLQEANVVLSCLCELYSTEPWSQPGCCGNAATSGIRTSGSGPNEKPDQIQLEYLNDVCRTMSETLGRVNAKLVAPPSSAPSGHPSAYPSLKPMIQPTLRPVTANPTVSPSQSPTNSSTTGSLSTLAPTSSPMTRSPTFSPIDTSSPTKSPTATPSSPPSDSPSSIPSLTRSLSKVPSVAPTTHISSEPSASSFLSGNFPTFCPNFEGGSNSCSNHGRKN